MSAMVVEGSAQCQGVVPRRVAAPSRFGHLFHRTVRNHWGRSMIRTYAALFTAGGLLSAAGLFGCANNPPPTGQPSFYHDLAQDDAVLDANAAQSMISGYRGNNGLGAV